MTKRQIWFQERKNKMLDLRKQGLTYVEISKLFGLSKQGAFHFLNYKKRYQKRYSKMRLSDYNKRLMFLRDNSECRICLKQLNWEFGDWAVHHIDFSGQKEVQNNNSSNLITLCNKCHGRYHKLLKSNPNHQLILQPIITRKEDIIERIFPLL